MTEYVRLLNLNSKILLFLSLFILMEGSDDNGRRAREA